ncbi:sodium-independent sulfate anion transporter-like [Chrysoperla carnea]|uniref:sodium-independent sulfate anion transporter-like n=1 Tax=Chrysoperla carnea TaxID=189513 RepID=UPI001D093D15|nr:sodium-independent sulfate anion transporter-like [Chrysoperla carnea]
MHLNLKSMLLSRIPILSWLPKYSTHEAIADVIAGITVGLTLIPQVIAYAALAGLSPQYGLYSSFAGSFVYMIFGTTPEVNIGPTALISLLTYTYTHGTDQKMTVLLCFLCGCVQFLFGICHLGFLVELVSVPVTIGFTSSTSLIIGCSQIKGLLGLKFESESLIDTVKGLIAHIHETNTGDAVLSLICCIILLSLRKLKDVKITPKDGKTLSTSEYRLQKCLWFISVARNAMIVVVCALVALILEAKNAIPFKLTGKIDPGLPPFEIPQFSIEYGNRTHTFTENVSHFGSGLFVLPLIALLQNIAIAKAFSKGRVVNGTQEMMTLGLCNIVGSFFGSYPVSGSFSRSAVSNASGIKTPMGGLYTGALVILALAFLTPYFYYIPKATLSSVIVCAIIFMIELSAIKPIWKTNKLDMIPLLGTFFACVLIGVELGILFGVALDLAIVLIFTARPKIVIEKIKDPVYVEYISVTPKGNLSYLAVNHVRNSVTKLNECLPIVLNGHYMEHGDFSTSQGLNALAGDLEKIGRIIIFYDFKPQLLKQLNAGSNFKHLAANTESGLNTILQDLNAEKRISATSPV